MLEQAVAVFKQQHAALEWEQGWLAAREAQKQARAGAALRAQVARPWLAALTCLSPEQVDTAVAYVQEAGTASDLHALDNELGLF